MNATPDADVVRACADLVGHTGARGFELGYVHDDPIHPDVPHPTDPGWYAHAQFRGARITAEGHASPDAACTALAERLLSGGQCQHCYKLVTITPDGVMAHDVTLLTGRVWTKEEQAAAGLCRWQRKGSKWVRGCGPG